MRITKVIVSLMLSLTFLTMSAQDIHLRKDIGSTQSRPSMMMHEMGQRSCGQFTRPSGIIPKMAQKSPVLTTPDGTVILGNLVYQASWANQDDTYEYPYGIYSFPASSDGFALTPVYTNSGFDANGGGVVVGDTYHFVWYWALSPSVIISTYYAYDIDDWSEKAFETYDDNKFVAQDLTLDPTSNTVYGLFWDPNSSYMQLATLDYSTMTRTDIGGGYGSQRFVTIAAGLDGQLYTIGLDGNLYKIDKTTAQLTLVGATGVTPGGYSQSMTFDPNTGRLYWSAFRNDQTGGLYEVNPQTGAATMLVNYPDGEEITALYIAKKTASGTPRAVTNLTLDYPRGTHVGTVSFTMPTYDNEDNSLTGELTYNISANGTEVKSGTAASGAAVSVDNLELQAGDTKVVVTVSNEFGTGDEATARQWIGLDNPVRPTILILNPDTAAKTAVISWISPKAGQHGGYINPDSLYYVVTRMPDSTVVGAKVTDTTFIDHLPDTHLAEYHYTITPYCGSMRGFTATTGKFISGNPFEVPYEENFDDANSMDIFSALDNNGDDRTWQYMSGAAGIYFSNSGRLDDWLLSPLIHLRGDRSYAVSYVVETAGEEYTEQLGLSYGKDANLNGYTTIMPTTELKLKAPQRFTYNIKPATDGNYVLAFHATSIARQYYIKVDSISVTEQALLTAPDSVTGLTAVPGERGANKAIVSFRAPTKTIGGETLASLSSVTLSRNGSAINTWNNPAPGSAYSYEDYAPVNGLNTYTIVAANESGNGQPARTTAFTGNDTPLPPTHQHLSIRGNTATMTWSTPGSKGVNNGFVDTEALHYNIYNNGGRIAQNDYDGTSWSTTVVNSGDQRLIYYGLSATANGHESELITSNPVVIGTPWQMPFHESFANKAQAYPLWWVLGSNATNTWDYYTSSTADDDGGAIYYQAQMEGEESSINSGKIGISGSNPKLTFSYYALPSYNNTLRVEAETDKADSVLLAAIDFPSLSGQAGWRKVSIPLSSLNVEYVILKFHAICNDITKPVIIDDINVTDVKAKDISATLSSPTKARVGKSINATVTVSNVGDETAAGAIVTLYTGDKEVGSQNLDDLAPLASTTVSFEIEPKPVDGDSLRLYAVVSLDGDGDMTNNITDTVAVKVIQNNLPAVDDLSAQTAGNNVTLSWTRPEAPETTSDDFESYDAWERNSFGDWSTYDNDNTDTWGIQNIVFPHNTGKMAFMVFNTDDVAWPDDSYLLVAGAHSGVQYLASFCAQNVQSDDYLCSPLLNGKEQKITFWAKSLNSEEPESFEVLSSSFWEPYIYNYSVVGGSSVQSVPGEWTEYSVTLPKGTRRFAIHHNSTDKFALLIDDITYGAEPPSLSGYNIYRDGELVGTATSGSTTWTDNGAGSESHTYYITAVYSEGESPLSNPTSLATGITGVKGNTETVKDSTLYNLSGQRVPSSYRGVIVRKGKKIVQ